MLAVSSFETHCALSLPYAALSVINQSHCCHCYYVTFVNLLQPVWCTVCVKTWLFCVRERVGKERETEKELSFHLISILPVRSAFNSVTSQSIKNATKPQLNTAGRM